MLSIGDIHVHVSDFDAALRFWADGLGLRVGEQQVSPHVGFARLDFPDGGPSLRLLAAVQPWAVGARPEPGARPRVGFDVTTDNVDRVAVRLIEYGGRVDGEIETYNDLRVVTMVEPDGNAFELLEVPERGR